MKHGLATSVLADPALAQKVRELALSISGPNASLALQEVAVRFAEAYVDFSRAREACYRLIAEAFSDPFFVRPHLRRATARLADRYLASEEQGTPFRVTIRDLAVTSPFTPDPELKRILIFDDLAKDLTRLERYERRARARWKAAVRQFDTCSQ